MFCPHCGTPYEAPASFCVKCGAHLTAPAPVPQPEPVAVAQTEAQPQPVVQPVAQPAVQPAAQPAVQPPFPPVSAPVVPGEPPAVDLARRTAASPLFLIAVICLTVSAVLSVITSLFAGSSMELFGELMAEFSGDAEMEALFSEFSSAMSGGMIAGTLIGMIPTILILIGLWMVYASAANRQQFLNLQGLALVKGAVVTELVVMAVGMGLVLLVMVLLLIVALVGGAEAVLDSDAAVAAIGSVVIVLLILLLVGLLVLYIVYYRKTLKSIDAALNTVRTGLPNSKVSIFVAVMCFIGAAGVLGSPSLATLASSAAQVLFGVILIQYRDRMRALEKADMP